MITESRLIPNLNKLHTYSARDVADLAFCYMLALHMCRQEFETAPWVRSYVHLTQDAQGFNHTHLNKTDLHQFLNVLISQPHNWLSYMKDLGASELLLHEIRVSPDVVNKFLRNLYHMHFDPELSGRLLLQLERELKITTSNYKSMRRILSDWHLDHVDTEAKRLVMTRLLQALRAKAAQGDLIHKVESLSRSRKWEITHACDPETGVNCDVRMSHTPIKKPSLLKQLAVGAGLGVGAYLLGKAIFGGSKK